MAHEFEMMERSILYVEKPVTPTKSSCTNAVEGNEPTLELNLSE